MDKILTVARAERAHFTFRRLQYFVAVGDLGSVTGAAAMLRVSAPSISAALVRLEEELGMQLFVRRRMQGMALTRGGRRMLPEVKKVLKCADNLHDIANDMAGKVAGNLHIGCLQTVAAQILPSLRKSFEAKFPDVRLHQSEDHQAGLLAGLKNADLDLCLTYDLDIPSDIYFDPLADFPPYVMLAHSHPLAGRDALHPRELAKEPMILLDLPISADYFLSMFQAAKIKPFIIERSKDMALVRSMVANGFGYSLGNIPPQTPQAPDGKLFKCVPMKGGRPLRLGLAFYHNEYETRVLQSFRAHCRNLLATTAGKPASGGK